MVLTKFDFFLGDTRQDEVADSQRFSEWRVSLAVLGIPFMEVVRVLAAILLIGNVQFAPRSVFLFCVWYILVIFLLFSFDNWHIWRIFFHGRIVSMSKLFWISFRVVATRGADYAHYSTRGWCIKFATGLIIIIGIV